MTRMTGRDAPEFTRSLTSLAALGAAFGIAPDADQGTEHPNAEVSPETSSLAVTTLLDTVVRKHSAWRQPPASIGPATARQCQPDGHRVSPWSSVPRVQ